MRGRKRDPNSRRNFFAIRLSDSEYAALLATAHASQLTMTDYVRSVLPAPTNPAPSVESVAG